MLLLRTDTLPEGADWMHESLTDIARLQLRQRARFSFALETTTILACAIQALLKGSPQCQMKR